jgi:protein-S-isoprenylcysteine O-methyltransferase Ste14
MKRFIIPPVFAFTSIVLIVLFYFILPEYNWIQFPINLFGLIISLFGFLIVRKVRSLFNKYKTTLKYKESTHMNTDGIFSKSRNPMYIGMFLLLLGIGICFLNIFSILTPFGFILAINLLCIPREERMMFDTFGQEYLDYKSKVRRWI